MFDLDTQEELSFTEVAPVHLRILLGAWAAKGLLNWPEMIRMSRFLGVILNPIHPPACEIHFPLAVWMLQRFQDWPPPKLRTGLKSGYMYEAQQQMELICRYYSDDEQSMILFRLTRAAKSLN